MAQITKESFLITTLKGKVFTNGLMEDAMKANGLIIKWKAKVYSNGQMEDNT